MPAPLVSPDIDLRDFAFMPLDVVRLRDSDLAGIASGDGFRAAVLLWCACWHQVPAASLPDDDRVLARLAGFGRGETAAWLAIKEEALRGFILCDDGRLYHAVIAEKAIEAWTKKQAFHARTEAARQARLLKQKPPEYEAPTVTEIVADDVTDSKGQGEGQGTGDRDNQKEEKVLSEPSSDLPAADQPKKRERKPYPDDYEALWQAYPTDAMMSKSKGFTAWERLSLADRAAALVGIAGFVAASKSFKDYRMAHLSTYLNERRWEAQQPKAAINTASASVFVEHESPQMAEWVKSRGGKSFPSATHPETKRRGWWMPSEWPPGRDLLGVGNNEKEEAA